MSAALLARLPTDLRPGTYVFRADAVDAAGNAGEHHPAGGWHGDDRAQGAGKSCCGGQASRAGAGQGAHIRPAALARPQRNRADGAIPRRRYAHAAGCSRPTAPAWPIAGCGSSPGLPEGRWARRRSTPCRRGHTVASGCALPAGPSRRIAVSFRWRCAARCRRAQSVDAPGSQRRRAPRLAARAADRGGGPLQRTRAQSRGAASTPRQAGRDPVLRVGRASAGVRCWLPAAITPAAFTPATGFATSAARPAIRLRAVVLAEERWPYAPGASRPILVRVTG